VRTHRRTSIALIAAVLGSILLPQAPSTAADPGVPRLQVRAARSTVELTRREGRPVRLDFGVAIASLDAPFDLRVHREGYDDPIGISQAIHGSDGITLQELPADVLDGWNGLDGFLRIRLFSLDGRLLRDRSSTICPAGWDVQRVDDSGPFDPAYPFGCYGGPFTLGTVWGIDEGWAVVPEWMSDLSVKVPDGDYRAVVSITRRYRNLFAVEPADASVELAVEIHTGGGCRHCRGLAAPEVLRERSALTAAPIDESPDPGTIVDLVALPAFDIATNRQQGRDLLSFGSNVWNRGPASLVVEGFRVDDQDLMEAWQYFLDGDTIVGKARVGAFEFDDRLGHHHWHFRQFARYRLLDGSLTRVVRSHKQSFCLAPTDAPSGSGRSCPRGGATRTTNGPGGRPSTSPPCRTAPTGSRFARTRSACCTTATPRTTPSCAR
jgi:Lysyl oxidase